MPKNTNNLSIPRYLPTSRIDSTKRKMTSSNSRLLQLRMNQEHRQLMTSVRDGIQRQHTLNIYLDKTQWRTVEELICAIGKPAVVYPARHSITRRHRLTIPPGECLSVMRVVQKNRRYRYVEGVCAVRGRGTHNGGYRYIRHAWIYDTWHKRHIDPTIQAFLPRRYFGVVISESTFDALLALWSASPDDLKIRAVHERCAHYPQYGNHDLGWTPLTYILTTMYWRDR